jgi:hypothetical protein
MLVAEERLLTGTTTLMISLTTNTNVQKPPMANLEPTIEQPRIRVQATLLETEEQSHSPNTTQESNLGYSPARLYARRGRRSLSPVKGRRSPVSPKSGRKVRFVALPKVNVYLVETPIGGYGTPVKRARVVLDSYKEMLRQLKSDNDRVEASNTPISGTERPHLQYMYDNIHHRCGRLMDRRNSGRPWKVWHKEEVRVLKALFEQIGRRLNMTEAEPMKECYECSQQKPLSAFPAQVGAKCNHQTNTCEECVRIWIKLQVDCQVLNDILCPQCEQMLSYYEVKAFVDPATFGKYVQNLFGAVYKKAY